MSVSPEWMYISMGQTSFEPGPRPGTVRAASGRVMNVPKGWELVPPGDAALTRRVKAAGEFWSVQERHGRRMYSRGVWAPAETIARIQAELEAERATDAWARRHEAAARRREKTQSEYVDDFRRAVLEFLNFHSQHETLAHQLADIVASHTTPVGSGTVARTKRISLSRRAEAAVIAWMRHETTGYDDMAIPRVRGERREVRRLLATRSRALLARYRRGDPVEDGCPLAAAIRQKRD